MSKLKGFLVMAWKTALALFVLFLVCDLVQRLFNLNIRQYITSPLSSVGININAAPLVADVGAMVPLPGQRASQA